MYEELKKYTHEIKSFHMPGHKNGKLQTLEDVYALDVTEVPGTDDLHHPTGIIKELQDRIATIYRSDQTYLLINGSTAGILATMATRARQQGSVLVSRNCHKSVYNSIYLHQIKAHYIYPSYYADEGFYGEVSPKFIEKMLLEHPDIHTVVITSPTYEGMTSDIQAISDIVHAYGATLVVDEAHGAHFTFSDKLPKSAIEQGADYVIQSTHKTLPCLTQTAILHTQKLSDEEREILKEYLAIYQSSSPSYLLMSSIEQGIDYMDNHRYAYDQWIDALQLLLKTHPIQGGYWMSDDPTRLTFVIQQNGVSGYWLSEALRNKHQIQVEMAGEKHIVAITSLADTLEDILVLVDGIKACLGGSDHKTMQDDIIKNQAIGTQLPQQMMLMHQAKQSREWMWIALKDAQGYTSRNMIIPYPPGIPLILPGEAITQEIIDYLIGLEKHDKEIYGIIKGEIQVLK